MSDNPLDEKPARDAGSPGSSAPAVGAIGTSFPPLSAAELASAAALSPAAHTAGNPVSQPEPATAAEIPTYAPAGGRLAVGRDLLLVALGTVLGAVLALGILFYVNGTIDFGQHDRVKMLDSTVASLASAHNAMDERVAAHSQAIEEIRTSASADSQRIAALKAQADGAQTALASADSRLQEAVATTTVLSATVASIAQENALLRKQIEEASARQVAPTAAPTPEPTPGPTVTPVPMVVASVMVTETIPTTPSLAIFPPDAPILAPLPGQGHLYGLIWDDANGSGYPESSEQVLSGIEIVLIDGRRNEVARIVTGADGRYLFANLDPNAYEVTALFPDGAQTVAVGVSSGNAVEANFSRPAP